MGVDPNSNVTIAYNMQNKTYAQNFMDIVLQPLTNQGRITCVPLHVSGF